MFYDHYPRRYFEAALQLAVAGYHDPAGALSPLAERVLVKGEPGESALQVQVPVRDEDVIAIRAASRLQIAALYYHALETFLRLFLAHAPDVTCPWMQLVRDEGPPFTEKLKRIEQFAGEWVGSAAPEDEHVRLVFFPVKAPEPEHQVAFGNAKSWLRFAAQEYRASRVNHALKHGISVRSGEPDFAFYSGVDPRAEPDAKPVFKWSGEALIHLSRVMQPDRSKAWVMDHRKLSVIESMGIIFLVQRWIQAILDVGELRFLGRQPKAQIDVPAISFEEYVEKARLESSPAWSMTAFSMPIGWADRAPPKTRAAGDEKPGL